MCVRGPVNHMQIQRSVPDTRGSTFAGEALEATARGTYEAGLGGGSWSVIQAGKNSAHLPGSTRDGMALKSSLSESGVWRCIPASATYWIQAPSPAAMQRRKNLGKSSSLQARTTLEEELS